MANLGFPETEEGFRDALDFLVEEVNKRGGFKASKEIRDRWRDGLSGRVFRHVEEGATFNRACAVVDAEDGQKNATYRKLKRMAKEKIIVNLTGNEEIVDGQVLPAYDIAEEVDKFPELVKHFKKRKK